MFVICGRNELPREYKTTYYRDNLQFRVNVYVSETLHDCNKLLADLEKKLDLCFTEDDLIALNNVKLE